MRARVASILGTTLIVLQTSCVPYHPAVTMTGEMATVRLRDGITWEVEILAVEDSAILCLTHNVTSPRGGPSVPSGRVKSFPAESISFIEVSGFRNSDWWTGVGFCQVLPAIGLAAAAASMDADAGAVFAVAMVPAVLTTVLYAGSGLPTPTYTDPLTGEDLSELRKYARYGGSLTPAQKEELLRMHGQAEIK